jgi:type 1 fimbria pilin
MPRRFLLAVLVAALAPVSLSSQSCSAWESKKSIDGITMTFRLEPFPWKVTADLDGNVTIQNTAKKSTCTAKVESVISVYFGDGKSIYFRSTEISSDELFTLDGLSCKEARKPKQLDPSEAKTIRLLRSLGICSHP